MTRVSFLTKILLSLALMIVSSCGQSNETSEVEITNNQQVQGRGEGKDNWWDNLPRSHWDNFEKIEQEQDWFEV